MLKFDDFKKLAKSQILNERYITGGDAATTYKQENGQSGDDWYHSEFKEVQYSGHVLRGGTAQADPR